MDSSRLSIYLTGTDDLSPSFQSASLQPSHSLQSLFLSKPSKSKRKQHLAKVPRPTFPLTDRQEVEQLSEWTLQMTQTQDYPLPGSYHERYNELYQLIARKKRGNFLPALSRSLPQICKSLDVTSARELRALKDLDLAEKSRSSRVYEEDLEATAKTLEAELRSLQLTCVGSRKANSLLRTQLLKGALLQDPAPVPQLPKEFLKIALVTKLRLQVQRKSIIKLANDSGFKDKKEFEARKQQLEAEVVLNTNRAKEAESQIKEVKQRLKVVRREQKRHFKEVLAAGEDTRSEGLAWVVKALWRLGESVSAEAFPSWLDSRTVQVVGLLAEKGVELEKLTGRVEGQRRMSFQAHAHPDHWNNVQARLQALVQHPLPVTSLTPTVPMLSRSETLFQQISQLKAEIADLQTEEMRRVVQECCANRMEEQLGADMLQILATVLGADVLKKERSVVAKMKQAFMDNRSRVKTFAFGRKVAK